MKACTFLLIAASLVCSSKGFVFPIIRVAGTATNTADGTKCTSCLFGVLSRSAILSAANRKKNNQKQQQPNNKRYIEPLTKLFIAGAIKEVQYRQRNILDALEKEQSSSAKKTNLDGDHDSVQLEKLKQKTERRKHVVEERRNDINACLSRLDELEKDMRQSNLEATKEALITMGFQKLISDPDSWKWNRDSDSRRGSPSDFGGLVYTSPLGVPILIGKQSSHGDSTLRRISQGADIWFQVSDYEGSRVLLRTSLARGLKNSKECRAMAANLAAYYSDARGSSDKVPVMYTDSKHVAKRGSKAGQMRKKKAFGELSGRPSEVASMAKGQEP